MLASSLRHFLGESIVIGSREDVHLLLCHDRAVVRAAGCSRADAEGLTAEGAIGRRHHNLRGDALWVMVIRPRQLSETATRAVIRIDRPNRRRA